MAVLLHPRRLCRRSMLGRSRPWHLPPPRSDRDRPANLGQCPSRLSQHNRASTSPPHRLLSSSTPHSQARLGHGPLHQPQPAPPKIAQVQTPRREWYPPASAPGSRHCCCSLLDSCVFQRARVLMNTWSQSLPPTFSPSLPPSLSDSHTHARTHARTNSCTVCTGRSTNIKS